MLGQSGEIQEGKEEPMKKEENQESVKSQKPVGFGVGVHRLTSQTRGGGGGGGGSGGKDLHCQMLL